MLAGMCKPLHYNDYFVFYNQKNTLFFGYFGKCGVGLSGGILYFPFFKVS